MLIAIVIMTSTGTNSFRSNRFIVAHLVAGQRIKIRSASHREKRTSPNDSQVSECRIKQISRTVAPEAHLERFPPDVNLFVHRGIP
jgi:hypothetical protein